MKKPGPSASPDAQFLALARARHAGNATALRSLGRQLLVGREAPLATAEGAELIAQAAHEGDAQAWSYVAVLAATGIGRAQSWSDALAALDKAAGLGDSSAARQTQLLRQMGLRDASHVQSWLHLVSARPLSTTPRLVAHPGFLTPDLCSHLIQRASPKLVRAQVHDAASGTLKTDSMRTNTGAVFSVMETDVVMQLVRARIALAANVGAPALEPPEILHYAVGECYRPHVDFFHPALPNFAEQMRLKGQRTKTCLIYLNDDYDGGETDFPKIGIKFRGGMGEALIFENVRPNGSGDMKTLHTGLAPTRGEKWLFSQWIRNKAQPIV